MIGLVVDAGVHPLAYRLLCLQAHYRSELEFSAENLAAALSVLSTIESLVRPAMKAPGDTDKNRLEHAIATATEAVYRDVLRDSSWRGAIAAPRTKAACPGPSWWSRRIPPPLPCAARRARDAGAGGPALR